MNIHDAVVRLIFVLLFPTSVLRLPASQGHLGRLGHGQHLLDGPLADALVQLLHGPLDQAALLHQRGTTEGAQLHPSHHRHSRRTVRHRRQPGQRVSCTERQRKYPSTAIKRSILVFMCKLPNEMEVVATEEKVEFFVFLLKGTKRCPQSSTGWLLRIQQAFILPMSLEKSELAEETDSMVIIASHHSLFFRSTQVTIQNMLVIFK